MVTNQEVILSGSPDSQRKTQASPALRYVRLAFSALLGVQLIALGVAAGSRALFLNEFGLSLGQVGETTSDWIQRLTLVPFQAAFVVAVYLSLTLPVPLWYIARDIRDDNLPPKASVAASTDKKSKRQIVRATLTALLTRYNKLVDILRNVTARRSKQERPKGFGWATGSGLAGPFTLITLGALVFTDVGDIDQRLTLLLYGLWIFGYFVAVFGSVRALDKGELLTESIERGLPPPRLATIAFETVGPIGVLLLVSLPFLDLASGPGQQSPPLFSQVNSVVLLLIALALVWVIFTALKTAYNNVWNQVRIRNSAGPRSGRIVFILSGTVVLVTFVSFMYADLYANNARAALEQGHALPARGLPGLLHDGISIYELDIDYSIEFPDSAPHFAATLAETDAEFGILLLEPNEFFYPTRSHPSVNRRVCNPVYGPECFDIGDFVWVPRDKVNLRYRLNP